MTTAYVQSLASQQVPPPYHFPDVTVYTFIWQVSPVQVQAYCDKYFNLGDADTRGFVYKAIATWPYATLMVLDYKQMIATGRLDTVDGAGNPVDERFANRGYTSQREVFVALPVIRHGTRVETFLVKAAFEWFLPFIIVDNPQSAVCGREMLGLEKMLATIALNEDPAGMMAPGSFSAAISLPGWKSNSDKEMQQILPFLDIQTSPPAPTVYGRAHAHESLWTLFSSRTASEAIGAVATLSDYVEDFSAGLLPTSMEMFALKQIRDAANPAKAVYQALVSCRSKYSDLRNFRFFNEKDVAITIHDTGSFKQVFRVLLPDDYEAGGANPGGRHVFNPVAAFSFDTTIDFDNMRTLHTFPIERADGRPPSPPSDDMIATALRPLQGFFGKRPA